MTEQPKKTDLAVTAGRILTEITPHSDNANGMLAQAKAAEITDRESFNKTADFIKICNNEIKRVEEAKDALTKPLVTHVEWIRGQFKPITELFQEAKALIGKKAVAWKEAEDARVAAEAAERQRVAEEAALQEAADALAQGDEEKADAIMDLAGTTPVGEEKAAPARGTLTGASGGLVKTWKGEVEDPMEICKAIVNGDLPAEVIQGFYKSKLNKFADKKRKEGVFFGIKVFQDKRMGVK